MTFATCKLFLLFGIAMQGQVKFFKAEKGFGFIVSEEAGNDVFFHISQCVEGYQPQEGDMVTFELGQGRDGRTAAKDITPTGESAPVEMNDAE